MPFGRRRRMPRHPAWGNTGSVGAGDQDCQERTPPPRRVHGVASASGPRTAVCGAECIGKRPLILCSCWTMLAMLQVLRCYRVQPSVDTAIMQLPDSQCGPTCPWMTHRWFERQ